MALAPLLPLFLPGPGRAPFAARSVMTGAALFAVGTFKGQMLGTSRWRAGLKTLALGGVATVLA